MSETEQEKESKRQQIAAMADEASACVACPLHLTRTKVAFGVGNAGSPLMLVGEGPGMNEDLRGEPFVGPAGKLLDECLYAAGMKREHVYITNIVKCRASSNTGGRIVNRVPTAEESGVCVPLWLERQIQIIEPRVILCLGGPAANRVIRNGFQITRERGKFFESRYVRYAIAALHPAYILRQDGAQFDASRTSLIADLIAAKEKAIAARSEPRMELFG